MQLGAIWCNFVKVGATLCMLVILGAGWCNVLHVGRTWCSLVQLGGI